MDFVKVLTTVVDFLQQERCRFAVIGAFGVHAYGLTRATQDLDLAAELWVQPKLVAFLEGLGYQTLHISTGYSNHVHEDLSMGRLDFVYVEPETARLLFDSARSVLEIGGAHLPVPRPEHLAAMKIHAMKNDPSRTLQELADIQFLMRLPGVDHEEIRGYFEKAGLAQHYDEIRKTL